MDLKEKHNISPLFSLMNMEQLMLPMRFALSVRSAGFVRK